jgi:hypothetical protein
MKVMPVVVILISRLANNRPLQMWHVRKVCVGRMNTCTLGSHQSVQIASLEVSTGLRPNCGNSGCRG